MTVSPFQSGARIIRTLPWLWPLLLLLLVGNVLGWLTVGVHPDEAYYWMWSERLQAGYFDHPPMVAWAIRLFTTIFGDHPWVIRLPSVMAMIAISGSTYSIARDAFPSRHVAGWMAVLVAISLPLYQVGFHIITPDAPYLFFTSLAYLALYRALTADRRWWLGVGVFGGLSLLSKYIAVLFPLGLFLALLVNRQGRQLLRTPWPYLAAAIAALVFSPVVYWNAQHEWISFLFQLGHGINVKQEASISNVLLFLASQLAVAMPWTLIAMIYAAIRSREFVSAATPVPDVLSFGFAVPIVFFSLTGFTMISGAHWPAAAYIPGSVLLGGVLGYWINTGSTAPQTQTVWRRHWPAMTIVVACLLAIAFANIARYRVNTQLANTFGWPELGADVERVFDEERTNGECVIASQYWGLSAAIAFALNKPHQVVVLPGGRISQYDLWREEDASKPKDVPCVLVVLSDDSAEFPGKKTTGDNQYWRLDHVHEMVSPVRTRWAGIYIRADKKAD